MLNQIIIKKAQIIHFIGIGGISMSALAKMTLSMGKKVTGSDLMRSSITDTLKALGVKINIKHRAKAVEGADLVVYTSAISPTNPEYQYAVNNKIKLMERSQFLGALSFAYENIIAIAGAHGKTTTTAMLARVMIDCGLNPTVHLGGEVDFLDGNLLLGGKKFFVTEACEYRKSFLQLNPTYSIILNVEAEHLDCYGSFANVKRAFSKFAQKTQKLVIYNKNHIVNPKVNFVSFDLEQPCNVYAKNLLMSKDGCYSFDAYKGERFLKSFKLNCIGKYNVYNALSVITLCYELGLDMKCVAKSLSEFKSVKRRFERLGKYANSEIIIDYAHHPTEIKGLIDAVCDFNQDELIVVFQPHTYSRTDKLFKDFIDVFNNSVIDRLIFIPTYSARESPKMGKSALDLYKDLRTKRKNVSYCENNLKLQFYINKLSRSKNIILFVGAGNIDNFARKLISMQQDFK